MLGLLASIILAQAAIPEPEWLRKPNGEDMARYYPPAAIKADKGGRALLVCLVDAQGQLVGCRSEQEDPPGLGFGEAVLEMAPIFKMKPLTKDGRSVAGGTVRIPVIFTMPDPLSGTLTCYGLFAAVADKNPTDEQGWLGVRFWGDQAMAAAAKAHISPSDFEQDLLSAHGGVEHWKDDRAMTQRAQCTAAMNRALRGKGR